MRRNLNFPELSSSFLGNRGRSSRQSPSSIPAPSRPKAREAATHGRPSLAQSDLLAPRCELACCWGRCGRTHRRPVSSGAPTRNLGAFVLFYYPHPDVPAKLQSSIHTRCRMKFGNKSPSPPFKTGTIAGARRHLIFGK